MEEETSLVPDTPEMLFQYILDSFVINDPTAILRHQAIMDNLVNHSKATEIIARCVIFVEEMLRAHGVYVKGEIPSVQDGDMYISKIDGHMYCRDVVVFSNMSSARKLCLGLLVQSVRQFGLEPGVVALVEQAMTLVSRGCGGVPEGLYTLLSYVWISKVVNSVKGLDVPVYLISYATHVYSDITLPRLGELMKEVLDNGTMPLLRHTPHALRVFYDGLYMSSVEWFRMIRGMDRDRLIEALPQVDDVVAVLIASDQPAADTAITDADRIQCILDVAQTAMAPLLEISVCVL